METDVLKSYNTLQQELERAKNHLQGLNDNIRRIIGRDPQATHLRGDRKRFNETRRNDYNNAPHERPRNRDPSPTPNKRRSQEAKSVFSRLSGPPVRDEDPKPKIFSRVIRELPTRQEIVDAQGTDAESRARNRRMFGCLMGTLQKFCQEESRLKQKEDKKAQIERKLEEQELQERENLKKERQNLFFDRKRQQLEVRKLEIKMNYIREFEIWEKSRKDLRNFIRSKSKPHIYYRPKIMTDRVEKRLAECRSDLDRELEAKRQIMNDEIQAIESRFKMLSDRINHSAEPNRVDTTASKHDRHVDEEEDDDSMCDEHMDDDQSEKVPSKIGPSIQRARDKKRRDLKYIAADLLNDTVEPNLSLVDSSFELDASQILYDDTIGNGNGNKNSSIFDTSNENKKEDKSD